MVRQKYSENYIDVGIKLQWATLCTADAMMRLTV